MPGVNVPLLDGELAWRNTMADTPMRRNWKYFLPWADFYFKRRYTPAPAVQMPPGTTPQPAPPPTAQTQQQPPARWPADRARPRTDSNSMLAHRQLLEKRTQGRSTCTSWATRSRAAGARPTTRISRELEAELLRLERRDFGWGADGIEHMLWRIENGELDGVNPKIIVIERARTTSARCPGDAKVDDITRGLRALVDLSRRKAPNATIVLTASSPRNDNRRIRSRDSRDQPHQRESRAAWPTANRSATST
jgi:hypothetical protein